MLSRRQRRVVELVAGGLKNHEIAAKLGIGTHVVRNYLSAIYDKVGVSNRVELALWYEARRHERRLPQ
jgi:DNA-binding NarL/FixJ family response regulator